MDRWVLDGDGYSFLRSAPRTFNLQNLDGPNRVEIFDITAIPSHRSAISETTCLCDIFGDDCESPSLSSSPATTAFQRKEAEQTFPVDDANDSSGSYHTASGSDSGDTNEVAYATPSPENVKDVSACDTRESDSSPIESTIFSDSKNGPLHCTPPATCVNSDDLSHADNWEEPQVSVSASLVNETDKLNASKPQDFISTPDTSASAKEHLEEREPAFHEHEEEGNKTPERRNASPTLQNVISSENKKGMNNHSSQQEDFLSQPLANCIRSPSELSNTSPADTNHISQKMSTPPLNRDIHFTAELKVPSSPSPVSREFSCTPVSTGKSSPALLKLSSSQSENSMEFQDLKDTCGTSTIPTDDNMENDFPAVSTATREPDARETPASSEISDICSSPDVLASAHSPELVIIHSLLGYTISPSPTNDRIVYSTEPEASPPPHLSDHHEICIAPAHSPEPVMAHSPLDYTISPSPTNDRIMYSTEPEPSPPPHVSDHHEICISPAHSPEPVMAHSPLDYAISPSPKNDRIVYSTEPPPHENDHNEICLAPAHSPELVIVHSPLGYTISPSPTNDRIVYSTEPEASPPPPETCASCDLSSPAHSPEPVIIHSPQRYSNNSSPINEREAYSTEPDASSSSPIIPGIDSSEICSSPDHSIPTHSPEPETNHLTMDYTISPSPTVLNERKVYSTEHEASSSSPIITGIDSSDICSSPDHSISEPETNHSTMDYNISPSPTGINERRVYSTQPEALPASPVITGIDSSDICSSPDHSISEPETNHSTMDYNISPSPTGMSERRVYSTECDGLPPLPTITRSDIVTPTYSRGSTPELRSITSTPNSRQNYLTPEPTSPAPSVELRSVTYSPEIKTMSYSVLPQNTNSPVIEDITNGDCEILASKEEQTVCGNYSETSNSIFGDDASVSPLSRNVLSTPGSISRPSSTVSDHNRDTASTSLEQMKSQPSPITCERINPSPSLIKSRHCDDLADTETFKQITAVLDKCRDASPQDFNQMQDPHTSPTSLIQIEKVQGVSSDDTAELDTESVEMKQFYDNSGTEMLKDTASSDMKFSHVPVALSESPRAICRDNGGEYDRKPCREKEESGKRAGEGVETVGECSYRGEQVELSFSARNRKGPAGHNPAPSSRDPKSGIPARCYFESHPTAPQQQSQLRAQGSQKESKGGARRLQSSVQGKFSTAGSLGEISSMGSEFDEADNEVKWFTDLAFKSLSSPQVDYLDVYNSSHRSSTNVSQPSTNVDSPGAVAWMNYADLRGSALQERDDLLHSSSFVPHDGLDPAKRFEMGSFECVDVALETKEESSRRKRTVPKRQIQLLRRNTDESKPNTENVLGSLSTPRHTKDTFVRQHSTPIFVQEEISREEPASPQADRKRTIQKSLSLDDASPKTQMASCIIKSVLSKKMQDAQKEPSGDTSPTGDENRHSGISPSSFDGVQSSMGKHSLSSSQHSECTFSSEDCAIKEERSPYYQRKKCAPKVPPKPTFRPAFMHTGEAELPRDKARPKLVHPYEDRTFVKPKGKNDKKEGRDDNTSAVVATPTVTMQSKIISRDTERHMTQENKRQQDGKSVFMSKTPEITLKPSTIKDKKKSSLKVSLSPDIERSREMCESQSMEKSAQDVKVDVTDTREGDKTKCVIHKVRDVRKLVKNTYSLSFKASTFTAEDAPIQEKREKPPQTPPALQIECKAISWKDKQTDSKAIHWQGETQAVDIPEISQPRLASETRRDTDITEIKSKASLPMMLSKDSQCTTFGGLNEPDKITERSSGRCDRSAMQAMPPRPPSKDREVSALMVPQDGTSKIQNTFDTTIHSDQIKATCSSHSVSMLLKEKGMQADIGVCDVIPDGAIARAKHVNRLEVPLQGCLSEAQASSTSVNTALDNNSLKTTHSQPKEQSESAKVMLAKESPLQQRKEQDKTEISTTTTVTQIPTNLTSCKPVVRSISSSIKNNAMPATGSKEIELPIQVRSISNDRVKSFVPPKPSYKQSLAEIKSSDPPKETQTCVVKQQTKKSDMHKDQLNEVSSNNIKRLAVSAVSSYKPPPIPITTTPSAVQQSTTTFASVDQSSALLQATSTSQQMTTSFIQDHSVLPSTFASNPSTASQTYSHTQPVTRASSNNRFHTEDYRFYASDDPPSYDERESFSPVRVSDLPPQRMCRFHPSTKQSACTCTQTSHSHQSQPQHNQQGRTPPASPGQVLACPGAPPQAQVRPHQCRPDGQPLSYLPVSTNPTAPHASALIQPLHHPRACPVPNTQSYGDDQPPGSVSHSDRRPTTNRSPQALGPAFYHDYAHSANMPQLFNPQELPPSFGHDYSNDGPGGAGVLYPENPSGISCGQAPRRVLLDPDTGKYFYVEVPMHPLRKMLFDPELGQYVEVLIPQQAMSHSGLYPPAAPPYSSLHNPGLYAPQYLPYAVPSYPAIPSGAQQVRHPEAPPVPTTLHQTSLRYGSPASQIPKNDPKGHTSLDQSYLESMYYIPTGINASPNSTPSDCYHKPSSNLPPGGRRV